MSVYQNIIKNAAEGKKMLAVLLDPEVGEKTLAATIAVMQHRPPDLLLVGGSHATENVAALVETLKRSCPTPVTLFPGNATQFVPNADALLNISLLSGRNAEYLIGQHVSVAQTVKKSGIEVIPAAYLLIDGGRVSSTEYISGTRPIPADRRQIAVSTALAGEFLRMKTIYLDAGSGAKTPVLPEMIAAVKAQITLPLIVGGGLRTVQNISAAFEAGADIAVVGNILEENPAIYKELSRATRESSR